METEAKPAPHGLVQALFDKRKKAELNAEITIKKISNIGHELIISIVNKASTPADKVSFIIDLYNILSVESKDQYDEILDGVLGKKHCYTRSTSQILPRFLDMPNYLKINHKFKPYVVLVAYYAKDLDFNGKYFLIDPINASIISEHEWFNEETSLRELLNEINL